MEEEIREFSKYLKKETLNGLLIRKLSKVLIEITLVLLRWRLCKIYIIIY